MEKSGCSSSNASGLVPSEKVRTVYVWDMDETLILLKSLLDGTYANSFRGGKDMRKSVEIGKKWENIILRVCDELFYYEEVCLNASMFLPFPFSQFLLAIVKNVTLSVWAANLL
jgi:hypothetical protein